MTREILFPMPSVLAVKVEYSEPSLLLTLSFLDLQALFLGQTPFSSESTLLEAVT
jgi:hypothetical protein